MKQLPLPSHQLIQELWATHGEKKTEEQELRRSSCGALTFIRGNKAGALLDRCTHHAHAKSWTGIKYLTFSLFSPLHSHTKGTAVTISGAFLKVRGDCCSFSVIRKSGSCSNVSFDGEYGFTDSYFTLCVVDGHENDENICVVPVPL